MTNQQDAPRFALHQRVRIIANEGGLYAAQIGVVGAVSKQRQKRRFGYRSYDVTYQNERGADRIVIVREDDLEAVESEVANEPTTARSTSRFTLGQRVKIASNHAGLYATKVGVIGHIDGVGDQPGARWHLVGYVKNDIARWVNVREDDLSALPHEIEPTLETTETPERREMPLAPSAAKPTKAPEKPPLFAKGDRVTVHPHSEVCYETFTRKGAVGVIMRADKMVRGIRRYQVLFEDPQTGGRRATRIREEHLVKVEPPAPEPQPEPPVVETAYVERSDGELVKREQIVMFACARDGKANACAHEWFIWPDGRYRHCSRCKLSERVEVAEAQT